MRYIPIIRSAGKLYLFTISSLVFVKCLGYYNKKKAMKIIRDENKIQEFNNRQINTEKFKINFKKQIGTQLNHKLIVSVSFSEIGYLKKFIKLWEQHSNNLSIKVIISTDSNVICEQFSSKSDKNLFVINNSNSEFFDFENDYGKNEIKKGEILMFNAKNECIMRDNISLKNLEIIFLKIRSSLKQEFDANFMEFYQ